jgi:hypothetical protein
MNNADAVLIIFAETFLVCGVWFCAVSLARIADVLEKYSEADHD